MPDQREEAQKYSVVQHPEAEQGRALLSARSGYRSPLLPAWGRRDRERALRELYHHPYNTIFQGAIAGQGKRIQSTPWEVKSQLSDGDRWQRILMDADFGGGWDQEVSKLWIDYNRHDQGAFIELIYRGDPEGAAVGGLVGISVLDSLRCMLTGDPEFPVIYYSLWNRLHKMHYTRVVQLVDSPDSDEHAFGIGQCSLSRCVSPVYRQILMGQYVEQWLDDKPPPGVNIWGNMDQSKIEAAFAKMEMDRSTDNKGRYGHFINLYGLDTAVKPSLDSVPFSKPPEGFDFEKYTAIDVKEIALGVGVDIQDIWELSGAGIGSGGQSQILAQKSRGKSFGRFLKLLERVINQALPAHVEFAFKYEDPQADQEQAQIFQGMAGAVQTVAQYLTPDEIRQYLANVNPQLRDILTNPDGTLRRLSDVDPKSLEQISEDATTLATQNTPTLTLAGLSGSTGTDSATLQLKSPEMSLADYLSQKSLPETFAAFAERFIPAVRMASSGTLNKATLRALLRDQLADSGLRAYEDGLEEGGAVVTDATAEEKAQWRRKVAEWLSAQNQYINEFADAIAGAEASDGSIAQRADLWASKSLRTIYFAGLADADGLSNYQWMLGATEKHCETCLTMNGQIHRMKEWIASGYLPGSSSLECGGYHCDCKLIKTYARSIGRLPSETPSLTDRLMGWLRGLLRRGNA